MNRFRLENFEENVDKLRHYLDANDGSTLCAVFDIGTKATKLLVGPKNPPTTGATWRSSTFFNDGQLFALGSDHYQGGRGELNIAESGALEGVVYFIETYRRVLQVGGVALEDMHAIGTAVFRWMTNQQQVADHIRDHAGFGVHVLLADDEAFLSCLSIEHTYRFGGECHQQPPLGDDDIILLFDQGGGSTEVSYFKPGDRTVGEHDSLHDFGTVALQEMFFSLHDGTRSGDRPDPHANQRQISRQLERVNQHLASRVAEWKGFPRLRRGKQKLHAYGMGSALSKLLGSGTFEQHNRVVTVENMDGTLAQYCQKLDTSTQQVRTLYKILKKEEARGVKETSRLLMLLHGLPVYRQLLWKFGLDQLRFAGFGLRYGAYLAVCRGMNLKSEG